METKVKVDESIRAIKELTISKEVEAYRTKHVILPESLTSSYKRLLIDYMRTGRSSFALLTDLIEEYLTQRERMISVYTDLWSEDHQICKTNAWQFYTILCERSRAIITRLLGRICSIRTSFYYQILTVLARLPSIDKEIAEAYDEFINEPEPLPHKELSEQMGAQEKITCIKLLHITPPRRYDDFWEFRQVLNQLTRVEREICCLHQKILEAIKTSHNVKADL